MAMKGGLETARLNRHRMTQAVKDAAPRGMISECLDCALFLVVDLDESPNPYGGVLHFQCGHKPVAPAVRRDAFELDWAVSSGSGDFADRYDKDSMYKVMRHMQRVAPGTEID